MIAGYCWPSIPARHRWAFAAAALALLAHDLYWWVEDPQARKIVLAQIAGSLPAGFLAARRYRTVSDEEGPARRRGSPSCSRRIFTARGTSVSARRG